MSLVLSGHYEEVRMTDALQENKLVTRRVGAGSFNWINGSIFHRINLPQNTECWSLFVHAARAKSWGFIEQQEYRDHNEIVAQASNPQWWKQAQRPVKCPQMRLPCTV